METTKTVAKLTWILPLIYLFTNRFIGLAIGPVVADAFIFFLAAAALFVAVVCLILIARYGAGGIFGHAIAGVLINLLILGIWIPNFLAARERARRQRTQGQLSAVETPRSCRLAHKLSVS